MILKLIIIDVLISILMIGFAYRVLKCKKQYNNVKSGQIYSYIDMHEMNKENYQSPLIFVEKIKKIFPPEINNYYTIELHENELLIIVGSEKFKYNYQHLRNASDFTRFILSNNSSLKIRDNESFNKSEIIIK